MFDINDPFYQDICTPYKYGNNTDILLSDRIDYIYNNKDTQCQTNCEFSSYLSNSLYVNCSCVHVEDKKNNEQKFSGKKLYESFYDILKYSNFKILKCSNLVFNSKIIKKNIGSMIIFVIFSMYLSCLLFFIIKGIYPLKNKIQNITSKEKEEKNENKNNDVIIINNIKIENVINLNQKTINYSNPVKKKTILKFSNSNKNKTETKRKKSISTKKLKKFQKFNYFGDVIKSYISNNNSNTNNFPPSSKNVLEYSEKKENIIKVENLKADKKENFEEKKNLDPFELNNLEYEEAIYYDKRTFMQTYWDILSREHKIIFTFIICNDYNLLYIKLARFVFLFANDMAMNVFFFSDDSMHKVFLNYGKYNFIQQIPQIIYTTIIRRYFNIYN